ncbi:MULTISPECIES: DUF768 domain-containing protein [unclassified Mesorhizobium]|uniref:DUF768 domain-containing protein n=1 Tax=unclassified Mesorhizobium TaxID=325217 RepID=UPI000FCB2B33|nr:MULTISPECIES: DUF768 domain-containing protein [unclassified Mesorhizobium]RUX96130.1 DUF768 domain-containing protein [Mesorhizobium sp. M7D.F.Ca.US.004.01.2.1]RVA32544.1 DUF768 domain-containing protein [Mesorhizobium sp. M7D.F.Ca.US.004.03.1.1]
MSARGLKFLDNWMAQQLPIVARGDPIAASDLADQLMTAAEKAGIRADEINGEVASVFEVIFEAMRRRKRTG